jgi:DNA-binding NarL/FixJ family response regulator
MTTPSIRWMLRRRRATTNRKFALTPAKSGCDLSPPSIAALPHAQREVFLMYQEGGLELSEIAALTGAGIETVKSRLRYALTKLRVELGDLQ